MTEDEMRATHPVGHIECPECHAAVPIGAKPPRIEDEHVVIDADLSDLWAHYFTHASGGAA